MIVDGPVPYDILSISNPKKFRMFACFCQLQKKRGPFKVETLPQAFTVVFPCAKFSRFLGLEPISVTGHGSMAT